MLHLKQGGGTYWEPLRPSLMVGDIGTISTFEDRMEMFLQR